MRKEDHMEDSLIRRGKVRPKKPLGEIIMTELL